jgi:hypothetical protein
MLFLAVENIRWKKLPTSTGYEGRTIFLFFFPVTTDPSLSLSLSHRHRHHRARTCRLPRHRPSRQLSCASSAINSRYLFPTMSPPLSSLPATTSQPRAGSSMGSIATSVPSASAACSVGIYSVVASATAPTRGLPGASRSFSWDQLGDRRELVLECLSSKRRLAARYIPTIRRPPLLTSKCKSMTRRISTTR